MFANCPKTKSEKEKPAFQEGIRNEREYQTILELNEQKKLKEKYGLGWGKNYTPTGLDIFM